MEWILAAGWALAGAGAATLARRKGYPVIWLSVLLGPLGGLAIFRLTTRPRPPLRDRFHLLQLSLAGTAGLPVALEGDLETRWPDLARDCRTAREMGRLPRFWAAVADYERYERFWDRALPWMVLLVGGGTLAGLMAGAPFGPVAAVAGALAAFLLADRAVRPLDEALARGREEVLARCAAAAGTTASAPEEGSAMQAVDRVRRLQQRARWSSLVFLVAAAAVAAWVLR